MAFLGLDPLTTYYFRAYASTYTHNYAPVDFTIYAEGSALDPMVGIEEEEINYPLAGSISKIFPSPAGSYVHVEYQSASQQNMVIRMTDLMGQQVLVNKMLTREGVNHSTFNIDVLPPGMYVVFLENNGMRSLASRFIKQ